MKKWNFQVQSNPKEISEKLESSIGGAKRFVFDMNYDKDNLVKFKIRKRLLLAFEMMAQNNIIVNGKIFKAGPKNKTDVEISFTHHPFSKLLIFVHILLGLGFIAAIILKASSNVYMLVFGGILLVIGFLLALHLKRDFNKNVREYKLLISKVLKSDDMTQQRKFNN